MIRRRRLTMLYPDFVVETILQITPEILRQANITHIIFDVDNTLIPTRNSMITEAYINHIHSLKQAGFTVLMGSNTRRDIAHISDAIGVTAVQPRYLKFKPFKSFYRIAIARAATDRDKIVMVGDHILNDVIGGNLSGLKTILVSGTHRRPAAWLYRAYTRLALRR